MYWLKDRLHHTWDAFFSRFGTFTDIQTRAIEPVLEGRNCFIVSPTASGKTEAVLAPLIERLFHSSARTPHSLSLLYIVPTRALANDLEKRLIGPLERLSFRLAVKTGDTHGLQQVKRPDMLITTPESLDSLLASRPRSLVHLQAVVLDELHALDNTPRGDQLRLLLNRLRRLKQFAFEKGDTATRDLQFCAMSATVENPVEVAERYFVDPFVVASTERREIKAEILPFQGADSLIDLFASLQSQNRKKVLVFCETKAECEAWGHGFQRGTPFGDQVFVHHGSLDREVRLRAEAGFSQTGAALCFATSTLELGIDIGDVDLVVLIGPPENSSAFLQRIGRGNRRTGQTNVIGYFRTEIEAALFSIFLRVATTGQLQPGRDGLDSGAYWFRPSVVVQQLCSYVKQTPYGEFDPDHAFSLVTQPHGNPLISKIQFDLIINHLLEHKIFIPGTDRLLKPGPEWELLHEQRAIYSNLTLKLREPLEVFNQITGRRMGEIDFWAPIGEVFLLGGHTVRAIRFERKRLFVEPTTDEAGWRAGAFGSGSRRMPPALAAAVAQELGLLQPVGISDLPGVTVDPEVPPESDPEPLAPSLETWVFHQAGEMYGMVLSWLLAEHFGVDVVECTDLHLKINGYVPTEPLTFTSAQVRTCLTRHRKHFQRRLDVGWFHRLLPASIQTDALVQAFDPERFRRLFSGKRISGAG